MLDPQKRLPRKIPRNEDIISDLIPVFHYALRISNTASKCGIDVQLIIRFTLKQVESTVLNSITPISTEASRRPCQHIKHAWKKRIRNINRFRPGNQLSNEEEFITRDPLQVGWWRNPRRVGLSMRHLPDPGPSETDPVYRQI